MSRSRLALVALVTTVTFANSHDTQAGCHSRRSSSSSYHRTIVRPVTRVVQPVRVVEHREVQVVQAAPVPAPPQYPVVPAGSTLTIPANFLGGETGSVFMVFQDIKLPVQIHNWTMTGVTISLPPMAIKDSVVIRLDVVLPDGQLGHTQKLNVTAPAPVVLHPTAPTSPLPTNAALASQP